MKSRHRPGFASAESGAPGTVRIGSCSVSVERREVLRDGVLQPLQPRAFLVLAQLIRHRGRAVSRDELMSTCWGDSHATDDSLLARAIRKIRQALGDDNPDDRLIRTVYGSGYELRAAPPAAVDMADEATPREPLPPMPIALLPVINATQDGSCAWVEYGLVPVLAAALRGVGPGPIVPLHEVLVAIRRTGPRASTAARERAVEAVFGPSWCISFELTGTEGHYMLHFTVSRPPMRPASGTVVGADPARMASEAAAQLRNQLESSDPVRRAMEGAAVGDDFLHEVLVRALECNHQGRHNEALHLLDVLHDNEVRDATTVSEAAKATVTLGRSGAEAALQRLAAVAHQKGSPLLRSLCASLHGTWHELHGRISDSIDATLEALNIAQDAGLEDLATRLMVSCASRMAMGVDHRADALLSRAIACAERLGDRCLLSDAYCASARIAGFRNDWSTALPHQLAAVTIANKGPEAGRAWPYGGLSWIQGELGLLTDAATSATMGLRASRRSGAQPQLGLAAGQAALAYIASRRIDETLQLHDWLQSHGEDRTVAMWVAREVHCRATLLCAAGRTDETLAILAQAREIAREHPRLLARCHALQLRTLLKGRRFQELNEACATLRESKQTGDDPRLAFWLQHLHAIQVHIALGKTTAALEQLHGVVRDSRACEAHALASLDAAWIHLERGEPAAAGHLVLPLRPWLEQSQPGALVAARLSHARGDWTGALRMQREFIQRYADTATPFHRQLLETYERCARMRMPLLIDPMDEAVSQHWTIARALPRAWTPPAGFGGGGSNAAPHAMYR